MAKVDYYAVLQVGRRATDDEIKKAYRRLAVHWHPDRNPGSRLAEEKFKTIAEAYAVLGNAARRRQYDLLGPAEFKNEYSREKIFQGFEPGDFFSLFGLEDARQTLSRILNRNETRIVPAEKEDPAARLNYFFAGFGQKGSLREARSPDIGVPLMITLAEAAFGAEKYVAYNSEAGAVKVKVTVPPGAVNGQKLTIRDLGPAQSRRRPGDLIVTLSVIPDPNFTRQGYDLTTPLKLSARDLISGCRPLVSVLGGRSIRLTVPPGTANGAVFKVPGYGLPKPDAGRGDLLVRVVLQS